MAVEKPVEKNCQLVQVAVWAPQSGEANRNIRMGNSDEREGIKHLGLNRDAVPSCPVVPCVRVIRASDDSVTDISAME